MISYFILKCNLTYEQCEEALLSVNSHLSMNHKKKLLLLQRLLSLKKPSFNTHLMVYAAESTADGHYRIYPQGHYSPFTVFLYLKPATY